MLTGDELREAREAARMTQQQVADRIDVSMRSVGNWERSGAQPLPRQAEARVRAEFPSWFGGEPAATPLSSVSDALLLAEIARRFERGREDVVADAASIEQPRARAGYPVVPTRRGGTGPSSDNDSTKSADSVSRRT